jgi:hypothetical protein
MEQFWGKPYAAFEAADMMSAPELPNGIRASGRLRSIQCRAFPGSGNQFAGLYKF